MVRRQNKPLRRRNAVRDEIQRFLLYCEGAVTERLYFTELKRELRLPGVKLGRHSGEPLGLVKAAIAHQDRAPRSAEDKCSPYDQVWCVFDVEAPHPHGSLDAAIELAVANDVRCAISNPCFELWLLLHMVDHRGYLTTDDACRKLETISGCGYSREGKSLAVAEFMARREEAIRRARTLDECYDRDAPARSRNPWTSVSELLHEIHRSE